MMAPQYGYYEDRALLQQRSNWTYVYKVDEQGKVDPPQLMLTTTYYPPNYYAPLQRTKITRIETVVRDVSGKNPYLKPKRQQVDDFGTDLREEVKVIAQGKLGSNYDAGDDDYAVANMGGGAQYEYNDHREVVRGDEVSRYDGRGPKEGVQRSPKVNGQNQYHQDGLGWYRGRAMDEQNRGNERSLEVRNLQRGGNGSYPQDHSGVDNRRRMNKQEIRGNYKMSSYTNQQGYNNSGYRGPSYRRDQSGVVKHDYNDSRLGINSLQEQLEGNHMTPNEQQYSGYGSYSRDHDSKPKEERLTETWTTPEVNPRHNNSYGSHDRYSGVDDYDHSKWRSKPMEDGRHRGYQSYPDWNTQDDVGYGLYGRRHQYSGLNDDDDNGRNWWKNKPPTDEHIAGGYSNFFFHRMSSAAWAVVAHE